MSKQRTRESEVDSGSPNKYKLPYGLAKGLGLDTTGMTPHEVWDMLKGKGISPKEEYQKLGEETENYLKHEDAKTLKEVAQETVEQNAKVKPALVDDETQRAIEEDENKYAQERKDQALWCKTKSESQAAFGVWQQEVFSSASEKERAAAYKYTQGSGQFNKPLRGYTAWGKEGYKGVGKVPLDQFGCGKDIEALSSFIDKSISDKDCWLQRGDDYDGAKQLLGITGNITEEKVQQLIDEKTSLTDHGFISCGSAKGTGFTYKPVIFNIYAPKGTKMLYVEGKSAYNGENEMILQRGTSYRATKVSKDGAGRIYIDLEVREQNPLDLKEHYNGPYF